MKNKRLFYFLLILTFVYGLYMPDSNVFAEALNQEVNPVTTIDSEKVETKEAKVIGPDGSTNSSANVTNEASISPQNDVADISEEDHSASTAPAKDVSKQQANAVRKEAVPDVAEEKEAQSVASGKTGAKGIFLNGESGDDSKDGFTKETAVKTFEAAKKKIDEVVKNIYITGTTNVEGDISLKDKDAKLVRHKDFNGYLLKVNEGKTATLKNITIDGNSDENKTIENSLVYVDGGTLNIEKGAVLRNNKIKKIENTATRGGAVYANNATVNMTGGLIEENQATYGGGVYLHGSTMNFSGGTVKGNESKLVHDTAYSQYYSAGGGIAAYEGSTIKMSGEAEVLGNTAAEIGGGISLGTNQAGGTNHLYMTGGTIDGNTAGSAGGGLFIQGGIRNGHQSIAEITAGKITNNTMTGKGKTDKAFGGGGIYVNGVANPWTWQGHTYYGANGELHIKNVLITDNTAKLQGAGMANCPISKTTIYVNDGAAIYGNHAEREGNDFFAYSNKRYGAHSGEAKYKLSKWMLGGAPFNWTTPDGKPLADDKHEGILPAGTGFFLPGNGLALNANSKGNALTEVLTKVIISGNHSATRGGGIGSNGSEQTIKRPKLRLKRSGTTATTPITNVQVPSRYNF